MGDKTNIEWTNATWNPIRARNKVTGKVGWHCEHATTGCEHCYSEGFNKRLGTGLAFKPGHRMDIEIFLDEQMLTQPLRWKKPRKIFVCSMTDAFADFVTDEMLDKMFAVMALAPQHTFQVLTKRAERMRRYMLPTTEIPMLGRLPLERVHLAAAAADDYETWGWCRNRGMAATPYNLYLQAAWPLKNVWLGVSVERQEEADSRIPDLLATPAAARFVSIEPLLGPIALYSLGGRAWAQDRTAVVHDALAGFRSDQVSTAKLDWVIVGGESGRHARSMHPDWARSLREQCAAAGTAFFFKQWGEWAPSTPEEAKGNLHSGWQAIAAHPHVAKASELYPEAGAKFVARVGKKAAGRLLDGVEHSAFPNIKTEAGNGV